MEIEEFSFLTGVLPNYPYKAIKGIAWRARRILRNRTLQEVETIATSIRNAIKENIEQYIERETNMYIHSIVNHGGWELLYAPADFIVTTESVRWLLDNWPSDADDRPNLPDRDDHTDLDALIDVLDHFEPNRFEGMPDPKAHELYAVLALMKIKEALEALGWEYDAPKDIASDMHEVGMISAGNSALEAMESVCYAERELSDEQLKEVRAEQREKADAEIRAEVRTHQARMGGVTKNKPNNDARQFVQSEWAAHREEYKKNKSAFARDYVRIVATKFNDARGDPLKITEKQMREVWLADTPAAGKQAG